MTAPVVPAEADPFRYGTRYVTRQREDGSTELVAVPLTLEDTLHPEEGDEIPVRPRHELDCRYLADVFQSRPLGEPIARVVADLRIDWGIEGLGCPSPDIALFAGMRQDIDPERGTLEVVPSGGRCLFVVEVVSPDRRVNDVVHKVREYHQAGVPLYVIVDQEKEAGPRRLLAYRYTPQRYEPVPPDDKGRVFLPPLNLSIGLAADGGVVCYDGETGRELGDYARVARELEEADRRNEQQAQALEDAVLQGREQRLAREAADRLAKEQTQARQAAERLAEEKEQARQKAEQQAREQAKAREEAEKTAQEHARARQKAEEQARTAEERIRQLEAALRALGSGGSGAPTP